MNLLVIEPGLKLWGSERAFLATVPSLIAGNNRVVVMLSKGAELEGELAAHDVTVVHGPVGNLHNLGTAARVMAAAAIARACRSHGIQKIYLNQAGLCRLVHAVARLMRLPVVIHVRLVEDIPRCERLPQSQRAPVDLIFISRDMRQRYHEQPGHRAYMAYDIYEPKLANKPEAPRTRDFICAGRIESNKGQVELITAMAYLREAGIRATLDIVGDFARPNASNEQISRRLSEATGAGVACYLGHRDDVPMQMAQARFVVVPSHYEGLGRVALEGWAAGAVPLASAKSGGLAEILRASGGGILADDSEPSSLASAMSAALALPESRRQLLVENGRRWMRENMSASRYRKTLRGVLFASGGLD